MMKLKRGESDVYHLIVPESACTCTGCLSTPGFSNSDRPRSVVGKTLDKTEREGRREGTASKVGVWDQILSMGGACGARYGGFEARFIDVEMVISGRFRGLFEGMIKSVM